MSLEAALRHPVEAARWLGIRAHSNLTTGTNSTSPLASSNSTAVLLGQLELEAAKSVRTSTIILASFNAVAAFTTAMGIIFESYGAYRKKNPDAKFRRCIISFVPTAEVFPLTLSLGIVVQGLVFAIAQSTGLNELQVRGCTLVSEFMLPAMFIVPFIQLVFGLEVTIRGLFKDPFPVKGKWNVTICLAVVGLLLLTTFVVANVIKTPDVCFGSLFWFVWMYAEGSFAILLITAVSLTICSLIIFVRLNHSSNIDPCERVAASRMVFYLALAIIYNSLLAPFFFEIAFVSHSDQGQPALTLSMLASVIADVSGLMTGGLHLFLRANLVSTFGPRDRIRAEEQQEMKHGDGIKRSNPQSLDFSGHITQPVNGPTILRAQESEEHLIPRETEGQDIQGAAPTEDAVASSREEVVDSSAPKPLAFPFPAPAPAAPETAEMSVTRPAPVTRVPSRKQSFTLFPDTAPNPHPPSKIFLPATTFSPPPPPRAANRPGQPSSSSYDVAATLKPPPSMLSLIEKGHRRDSSMVSSATVQIGLRLSNLNDLPPFDPTSPSDNIPAEDVPPWKKRGPGESLVPSPLRVPSTSVKELGSLRSDPVRSARMKTLPPVPPNAEAAERGEREGGAGEPAKKENKAAETMLSPKVYSPQSPTSSRAKVPSPRGVGFAPPSSSSSSFSQPRPGTSTGNRPPAGPGPGQAASSSPSRPNISAAQRRDDGGGDWI